MGTTSTNRVGWNYWMAVGTTSSSTGTAETWVGWNSCTTSVTTAATTSCTQETWVTWTNGVPQVAAEHAAERERREKKEVERRAAEATKEEKARQLLREVLTDEQDKQFEENGYFELTAVKTGNKYRIKRGRSKNVELVSANGKTLKTLCFHPQEYVHNFDTLVAQKLMLETDEEEVQRVANYS